MATIIDALQALIDHPRTPVHERDAARRALARKQTATPDTSGDDRPRRFRFEGSKFRATEHLSPKEVAALIRNEIKAIRKAAQRAGLHSAELDTPDPIATLPREAKVSVRQTWARHTPVITVIVRELDGEVWWRRARGFVDDDGLRAETAHVRSFPRIALYQVGDALAGLVGDYNYDDSDSQTDYFHQRFFINILAEAPGSDLVRDIDVPIEQQQAQERVTWIDEQ